MFSHGNRILKLSFGLASLYNKLQSSKEEFEKLNPKRDYENIVLLNDSSSERVKTISNELNKDLKCHSQKRT